MTDKLYTQKEVDDLQRLAQAVALKEAVGLILAVQVSSNVADWKELPTRVLALSDQSLLAQHDAALREDYNKKLVECSRQIHAAIQQASVREAELRAEAAAVMEKMVEECVTSDGDEWDMHPRDFAKRVRALIPTDYADALREQSDEVAWLIECGGLCLGFCEYRFRWITFTDENALRFSRQRDGYSFIESMKWQTKAWGEMLEGAKVTEHLWDKTPRAIPLTSDAPDTGKVGR